MTGEITLAMTKGRFVAYRKKTDFICKKAVLHAIKIAGNCRLICLAINTIDSDVVCEKPVSIKANVVCRGTSSGHAHPSQTSVATAVEIKSLATQDENWMLKLSVKRLGATHLNEPLFDANANGMHG